MSFTDGDQKIALMEERLLQIGVRQRTEAQTQIELATENVDEVRYVARDVSTGMVDEVERLVGHDDLPARIGAVLDLPGVVERVPGDPLGGVAWRPALRDRRQQRRVRCALASRC